MNIGFGNTQLRIKRETKACHRHSAKFETFKLPREGEERERERTHFPYLSLTIVNKN